MNSSLAVEATNLTVRFGEFKAVDRISFEVPRGEIFGFLGANGAGKTTTIRVLCGLLEPTEGKVQVAGISFEGGLGDTIKSKVGYMSQKFTLYDDLSVMENLDFIASLRKIERSTYLRRRKELFDFISFDRPGKGLVRDLPGGLKQQVSLAASLLHDPEIVFLDEPTAGVTPAARARFWSLIQELAKRGKTVFVTTHYMDEAEQCERIALMRTGEIIALDSPAGLKKRAFPDAVYELTSPGKVSYAMIDELNSNEAFDSVEPYGLRFHVSIHDQALWEEFKTTHGNTFQIRQIEPSLEDVFIRMVEGKTR